MLRKRWTKREKAELLRKLRLIADTREQKNGHIIEYCEQQKVPVERRKLDVGDYSLMIGDMTLEDRCVIERKHGLNEVCVNMGKDRERFETELLRAKAFGIHMFLLIEGAGWGDILTHNYNSAFSPSDVIEALTLWQVRYGVTIVFCEENNAPLLILLLLYHWAMKELDGN